MLSNCGTGEDCWYSLDSKEIKLVNLKENQLWIFIGRTDAEAEAPILWPPDVKRQLIGKDPHAGTEWRQTHWKRLSCWERLRARGEGATEDETVGWHHRLDGHEFVQAPGIGDGQGSLVCWSPWGHKELNTTEQLSSTGCKALTLDNCSFGPDFWFYVNLSLKAGCHAW